MNNEIVCFLYLELLKSVINQLELEFEMPIDHQYKDGVTTLLQFLPESELIELAKTVSGQRITVSNDTGLLIYMFHHCCLFLIYFFQMRLTLF